MGWVPLSKTVLHRNKKSEHIPNLENVVRIFLVCLLLPKKMHMCLEEYFFSILL